MKLYMSRPSLTLLHAKKRKVLERTAFPVCYYHFCEEKGRAAKQDFSTADLQRCWLILKPCWTTAFYNFLYKIFSSFGPSVICVLKAYWIFESLETNDVKLDLWSLYFFLLILIVCLTPSKNKDFCLLYICVHAYVHIYIYIQRERERGSILGDAIMYWIRLFCYWNLLRFLFRK